MCPSSIASMNTNAATSVTPDANLKNAQTSLTHLGMPLGAPGVA